MNRILVAHTPLGKALWAVALNGKEEMSQVYKLEVKFKSERPDLDCQAMIGERCVIELEADRRIVRHIAGQMINFAATGRDGRHWCYEAT
ncbi:MAG: hypothetical protein HYS20_10750, partial [Rhodocyclales bacterium]|nr:hypothetical protein [Rhodocyclales bacterium]